MKKEGWGKAIFVVIFLLYCGSLFQVVLAQESLCCPEKKSGALCEDISQACNEQCTQACFQTACNNVDLCKKGCCINPDGRCMESSTKGKCESEGGRWDPDKSCGIDVCKRGCCIIRNNANLYTSAYCSFLAQGEGREKEFFPEIHNEALCRTKVASREKGACVMLFESGNRCSFLTEQECLSKNPPGRFFRGFLCTAQALDTECKPTQDTTCLQGKDEVYFVDSCQNPGNIYDSSRIDDPEYWERIIQREDSCNFVGGNIESQDCGNCNPEKGSICNTYEKEGVKPDYGNFICKDIRCDDHGRVRQHGESWCAYEGSIDNGSDVVGSRHVRRACVHGNIVNEPCADYRAEICAQKDFPVKGEFFSKSKCISNPSGECRSYNLNDEGKFVGFTAVSSERGAVNTTVERCLSNPLCFIQNIDVDSGFKFSVCLPRVAPGFDYSTEEGKNRSLTVCGMATQTCKIGYAKEFDGFSFSWKCVYNCDCEKRGFVEQMNNFCARVGDCGAKVNILNDRDKAYKLSGRAEGNVQEFVGSNITKEDVFIEARFSDFSNESFIDQQRKSVKGSVDDVLVIVGDVLGIPFLSEFIGQEVFGIGDIKYKQATFTCLPWQAGFKEEKCEGCGNDPLRPCSKYRCQSLGQHCKFLNEGTGKEICEYMNADDVNPPLLFPDEEALSSGYQYQDITADGFRITKNSGCVDAYTVLHFGINTDTASQCKISLASIENQKFDDPMIPFLGDNFFNERHIYQFSSLSEGDLKNFSLSKTGEMNFFVKCRDANGNIPDADYRVKICVLPGPDLTEPAVTFLDQGVVRFNASSHIMDFYTNEPAECRWSREDIEYSKMKEIASCKNDPREQTFFGFFCNASVSLDEDETSIFVRCRDQPFDFINESDRNTMSSSTSHTLMRSRSPLSVTLDPDGTILDGKEPVAIDIIAHTLGGLDGTARCNYEVANSDGRRLFGSGFLETGDQEHRQPNIFLYSGSYLLKAFCRDGAGNFASVNQSLIVTLDTSPPIISRAFHQSGKLVIVTDEAGECRFSNNARKACGFYFANATRMDSDIHAGEQVHKTSWLRNQYYYIKCRDIWGNLQGDCGIRVRTLG